MEYFAGLDVSVKETSVCVVDGDGRIVREAKVASEPEALITLLRDWPVRRIGLEAGTLSQWLWSALAAAGLPAVCIETRQMHALLKAHNRANKSDRNDARGIAQMMRVGLYRAVHVKTERSQKLRMLLRHRKLLKAKALDVENDLRGTLRNFGLKVGVASGRRFEARIRELVAGDADLAAMAEPLLLVRQVLREQAALIYKRLLVIAREDGVAQRLMTIPGVGALVALGYVTSIDVPARFARSKAVGAAFGLTPSQHQSGETQRQGRISRCGDAPMRELLYEAAQVMLFRSRKWSWLKAWAMKVVRRCGAKKGIVALARRLAVIMHRMWVDGTTFRITREDAGAHA
jgi:transposase